MPDGYYSYPFDKYIEMGYGEKDPVDEIADQLAQDIIAEADGDLDMAIRVIERTKYLLGKLNNPQGHSEQGRYSAGNIMWGEVRDFTTDQMQAYMANHYSRLDFDFNISGNFNSYRDIIGMQGEPLIQDMPEMRKDEDGK